MGGLHGRCDQMIAVLNRTIELQREELQNLRRERNLAMDRLLVSIGRADAITPALEQTSLDEPPAAEDNRSSAEIEADAIDQEQRLMDTIHQQTEEELRRYADGRGVPVDALRDV